MDLKQGKDDTHAYGNSNRKHVFGGYHKISFSKNTKWMHVSISINRQHMHNWKKHKWVLQRFRRTLVFLLHLLFTYLLLFFFFFFQSLLTKMLQACILFHDRRDLIGEFIKFLPFSSNSMTMEAENERKLNLQYSKWRKGEDLLFAMAFFLVFLLVLGLCHGY